MNCALLTEYLGGPYDLLSDTKKIEMEMGRTRLERWGPRIIDIDILLFEDVVLDDEDLKIPHPELHKRRFALIPVLEIDKKVVHPVFKKELREFLPFVEKSQKVKFLKRLSLEEIGGREDGP